VELELLWSLAFSVAVLQFAPLEFAPHCSGQHRPNAVGFEANFVLFSWVLLVLYLKIKGAVPIHSS
jgi:hypothetical protein